MSSKGKDKGKQVVTGKRKVSAGRRGVGSEEERRKRRNRAVLQFFEDTADVDDTDSSDDSDDENYFMEEEPNLNVNKESGKTYNFSFVPKEEVIGEEEFDKMMEERYRDGSGFVKYAEDSYEAKGSIDKNSTVPSTKDPTIWKVKCVVGRERHSAFCLMQKFVDMKSLGNKLQIISAFSVDHVKGFFYIEADRLCDINEACKGLTYIYCSRVAPVPSNEVYHLLTVRNKHCEVSEGMWARVKNGKYKGDLAQVVAVNNERKRATVKLIPRIDLRALAAKFGGGVSINRTVIPAPKLISSAELEEFRPLIQYRRDRDTGIGYQILDGMMLKDGYLYKRVSIDSLSCWGVMPTEEELLKFSQSDNNESDDLEWLSQLYGEKKRKKTIKNDKVGGKGEGSSEFDVEDSFELYNLVCFGRKDFGLIVGMEKDNRYKILKEASEGPVVVTVEQRELKTGPLDTKFTALDHHSKTISINDTVKVLEGQHEGKQGIVRQIYRGTVFLYDENETDNGGYLCCKSQMCEKIKQVFDACNEKVGGEPCSTDFGDFASSPKSPLSPKKPWQEKESRSNFNKGNRDGMFSIGQTLRIRVGPLKGYLCRVLAVHYSDVTVKLDSKQKVLTVKNEHLAEVQGKNFVANTSEQDGSSSFKPFDLGTEGSSGDWLGRAGSSADTGGWNAERSSWPSFSGPDTSAEPEDTAWGRKATSNENSAWGAAVSSGDGDKKTDGWSAAWENNAGTKQNSAWASGGGDDQDASLDGWNKAASKTDSAVGATDAWGKAVTSRGDPLGASGDGGSWGQAKFETGNPEFSNTGNDNWKKSESWDKGKNVTQSSPGAWDNMAAERNSWSNQQESWGTKKNASGPDGNSWGNVSDSAAGWTKGASQNQSDDWNKGKVADAGTSWGKQDEGSSRSNQPRGSSWGEKSSVNVDTDPKGWKTQNDGWKPSSGSEQESVGWDKGKMEGEDGKDSSWGSKSGWNSGSAEANQDSNWGKKSNWGAGNTDASQNSGGGKVSGWNSGSAGANQDSSWSNKNDLDFGSGDTNKDSSWGKKSADPDSGWGKKGSWNAGSSSADPESGWGKKGSWNAGSSSAAPDSGWGKKSNWNLESGEANQDSGWKPKSNWRSGSGNEDQEPFNSRGSGGSWRGGFGGRDGSGRGFRGRGDGDRGGFRGRGRSDRGGYGGRGRSDGGGFGGRGGDGGGYRGRGGDRGGYRGRGGDREGFGGRGRGRRDQAGGWNNDSDSGENKSFGWNKEANSDGGWKSNNEVKWKQGWNGGSGSGGGGKTWNQSNAGDQGGQSSSWSQSAGTSGAGWKSSNSSDGTKWSGWNQSGVNKDVKESNSQGGGWDKSSTTSAGGWNNQGSGGSRGSGSGDQAKTWNQSNTADGQSSGGGEGNQNSWGSSGNGGGEGSKNSWGSSGNVGGEGNQNPWGSSSKGGW